MSPERVVRWAATNQMKYIIFNTSYMLINQMKYTSCKDSS